MRLRPIIVGLLSWLAGHALAAEPLQWIAADVPPFAWQEGAEAKGYASDLVKAMSRKLGRSTEITFYPWARAAKLASEKPNFGIFPLARTPDREHGFLWLIPLAKVEYVFLENSTTLNKLAVDGAARVALLRTLHVGVLRGSPIINNLRAQTFTKIVEGKDYQELLRMLAAKQLDAVYAGRPMILASVTAGGYSDSRFHITGTLGEATLYLGASKGLVDAEVNLWRSAYEELVADGSVAQLQKQYGLAKIPASGSR